MVFSCFAVYVLANKLYHILILSQIINPSLKLKNPASSLCTISLFRCMCPAPLREVCILENRVSRKCAPTQNTVNSGITWPHLSLVCTQSEWRLTWSIVVANH